MVKNIKNINLEFDTAGKGLFETITTKLSNISFENISIKYNTNTYSDNRGGIILNASAEMDNLDFKNIEVIGEK